MGYLKVKSSLMIFDKFANLNINMKIENFCVKGIM